MSDKPAELPTSTALPAEAAHAVQFSADEVELVTGILHALCDGRTPWIPAAQARVLTAFAQKLEALDVAPLDLSELGQETEA